MTSTISKTARTLHQKLHPKTFKSPRRAPLPSSQTHIAGMPQSNDNMFAKEQEPIKMGRFYYLSQITREGQIVHKEYTIVQMVHIRKKAGPAGDFDFNFKIAYSPVQELQPLIKEGYVFKSVFELCQAVYTRHSATYQQPNLNGRPHLHLIPIMNDEQHNMHMESNLDPTIVAIVEKRRYVGAVSRSCGFNLDPQQVYIPPFVPRVRVRSDRLNEFKRRFVAYRRDPVAVLLQSFTNIMQQGRDAPQNVYGYIPLKKKLSLAMSMLSPYTTYIPSKPGSPALLNFAPKSSLQCDLLFFQQDICDEFQKTYENGFRIGNDGYIYVPSWGNVAIPLGEEPPKIDLRTTIPSIPLKSTAVHNSTVEDRTAEDRSGSSSSDSDSSSEEETETRDGWVYDTM